MWDATGKGTADGFGVATGCDEGTVGEVGVEPGKGSAMNAKPGRESIKKNGRVDGIKCG